MQTAYAYENNCNSAENFSNGAWRYNTKQSAEQSL